MSKGGKRKVLEKKGDVGNDMRKKRNMMKNELRERSE